MIGHASIIVDSRNRRTAHQGDAPGRRSTPPLIAKPLGWACFES